MASCSSLALLLSAEEFQALNTTARQKIDEFFSKKESDFKIQLARYQSESEQKLFELDSQLQLFRDQKNQEDASLTELSNQKRKLEEELHGVNEQLKTLKSKTLELEDVCCNTRKEKDLLFSEKNDLSSLLSRKNDDVDRLTAELKVLTDQLLHANKDRSEAVIKTEELHSKQLALEYKEKRLDQERELVMRQIKVLQDELDARTKEIMNMRREKTSKLLELQADLTEKVEELKICQRSVKEMSSTIEEQEKQIKELHLKVKKLGDDEQKMAENTRNELRSQSKLCELYKASSEDAQAKADELAKATEELQRLLRDASVRYGELETESKGQIDCLNEQLAKSLEANIELKKELERANALLDASKSRLLTEESIEAMSPSAAAASRLLKSGMTLTQIYSQYVTVSEQLLLKEEENKKLNSYIDQILQEIEDRAPIIARQREDYEKSIEMAANLTKQLDLASEEAEQAKDDALEARRLLGQSQRNNQRLEKQITDLRKQVCFLLREVEELRGNKMRDAPSEEEQQVSSTEEGSAGAIISRHLVTFRDVEELQHRNHMLLNTLREVTEKQEEAEQQALTEKTIKIEQALEKALAEVQQMRDSRRRQEELVQNIIQERDMYRILAQEAGISQSRSPSKFRDIVTSTPSAPRLDSQRANDTEKQLDESKIRLEEHEANYRTLVQEKKELEKALNNKIDKLQDSLADLRAQNARLGTQIEYASEKEKLLMGNLDGLRKQINILEEKNKMFSCTVGKHEQSIAILRDEALNAQQQLARAEVTISMLREEKQLLKDTEQRLLIERDSLLTERRCQNLVHVNLESIKLNLERNEHETRVRLQNTITSLEQQIELLRKKLEMEDQRYKETVKSFEERNEADKVLLKETQDRASQAEAKLVQAQELLSSSQSSSLGTSPGGKQQVARLLSNIPEPTAAEEEIKNLLMQLAEIRTENSCVREQLQLARDRAEQYRSIADSMEEQLKKSTEAASMLKEETEQRLIKLNEEKTSLLTNLEEANDKIKKLEQEMHGQTLVHNTEEMLCKMNNLEIQIARLNDQLKVAEESEKKAREDFVEQAKQAKEAQDRYERELMQHAADIEQLNAIRDLGERNRLELSDIRQSKSKLEEELETARSSWENQKETLEKEIVEKNRRCSELDKQVDLMQQQIVNLSTRMAAVTRVTETPIKADGEELSTSLNVSVGEEETRTADQLLELVRFLRREKEIAISRFEVQEAEAQRLKTQLDVVERNLKDAQMALQQERERSATSTLTFEKHTEMLRRLETLNALTDSNRLLREERINLVSRLEDMTSKVTTLEVELEPLKNTNHELAGRVEELSNENQALRKQVVTWKSRTTALQERVSQASAIDVKRLQSEKEQLQKQFDQLQKQFDQNKEASAKIAAQLTETQRTNTTLVTAQQKLQEEARKAKEEVQKLQVDANAFEVKRADDATKATEQANQLRRIARKYKTQYEELKVEHDKLVLEKAKISEEAASSSSAAATTNEESNVTGTETAAITTAQASRIQELEERITQITTEMETIKTENQNLKANDEKTKNVLKTIRQKLAAFNTLTKEKESLTSELAEAKAKIEALEQGNEEVNVRSAALRSQLEGRLARLERENAELTLAKQSIEDELKSTSHSLATAQRQAEAFQKQLSQSQQPQQAQLVNKPSGSTEVAIVDNPPTANIKPMATSAAVVSSQRSSSVGSAAPSGQTPALTGQIHRTTPTASIRPMAASRTAAVQPTVSISPMAISAPSASVQPALVVRDESASESGVSTEPEPVMPSTSGIGETRQQQKRTRTTETEESPVADTTAKRTRLTVQLEEGEILDLLPSGPEELDEEDSRGVDAELAIEYEEAQPNDEQADEVEDEQGDEDVVEEFENDDEGPEVDEEDQGGMVTDENEDQRQNEEAVQSDQFPDVTVPAEEEQTESHTESTEMHAEDEEVVGEQQASSEQAAELPTDAVVTAAVILPPPREERLPPFGRNAIAYDDGGDDGIVPSTPALLPPRANDGFAEAVSSPQVNTRFVFGTVPEMPSQGSTSSVIPATTAVAPSHLESQGIEDTRVDLSQLEENTSRGVAPVLSLAGSNEEIVQTEDSATSLVPAEEQADFEGGPDMEGDAAAEMDLLRDEEQEARESGDDRISFSTQQQSDPNATSQPPSIAESSITETPTTLSLEVPTHSLASGTNQSSSLISSGPGAVRGSLRRGSPAGYPRSRGTINRETPRMSSPAPNRPVPITWTPSPTQPTFRENPNRVFRRGTTASPAGHTVQISPGLLPDPVMLAGSPMVSSPPRARGTPGRGRPRSRAGRRP